MKVQVRWTQTIERVATVEVDVEEDVNEALLMDLDPSQIDATEEAADVQILERNVVDEANVRVPAGVRAPAHEPDWED